MKERSLVSLKKNLVLAGVFAVCFILIRLYGWWAISDRIGTATSGLIALQFRGVIDDFGTSTSISLGVIVISQLIALASVRAAYFMSIGLFSVFFLLSFSINQFFVETLTPLSADLLGYSTSDIATTVGSSGRTLLSSIVVCAFFLILFWSLLFFFNKRDFASRLSDRMSLLSIGVLLLILFLPWRVRADRFENDLDYFIAVNKTRYLSNKIEESLTEQSEKISFSKDAFPLLRKAKYNESLGSFFNSAESGYPNLVFIIVEGLGRDFSGANATYGGFTPFLDSLSQKSLYWENGLSNAGRTFGAPPSILGSLPYGKLGMMGYANNMPNHQTLISLLKPFGYQCNFFYGGNPNFDNLDLFLERQAVDYFLNESNYPGRQIQKTFWGYSDGDVFKAAIKKIENEKSQRLDIYLTLSTHEPFVCPDSLFAIKADQRINEFPESKKKEIMIGNKNVFECLLYTDHAIKDLMEAYSKRSDFGNTIFVITGDHRLMPVPHGNKIKRYHVPILIYSPFLKRPQTFSSLATHSDILPSLLGFLKSKYQMSFPEELPLISDGLSIKTEFSSDLDIAFIRNKNEVKDFVSGDHFLSEDRLFTILPNMELKLEANDDLKRNLKDKLRSFQTASIYAYENNKLDRLGNKVVSNLFALSATEQRFLKTEAIEKLNPDDQFNKAKELAFAKDYNHSRCITKYLLNKSPNYHDARILLARTYAWSGKYDSARLFLEQTIKRAPSYADAYVALSDVSFWQDNPKESLIAVESGLKTNEADAELLSRKARALISLNRKPEAKSLLNELTKRGVENEIISQLRRNLK